MADVTQNPAVSTLTALGGTGGAITQPTTPGAIRLGAGGTLLTQPNNLFQTYGISINRTGTGVDTQLQVQAGDNITMASNLNIMYKFAQTKMSALPSYISMTKDLPSGAGEYNRRGDVDLQIKNQEASLTPNTTLQIDKRVLREAIMHQGFTEGLDVSRRGMMLVTPYFQESVAWAIARNMDKWVQIAATDDVVLVGNEQSSSYFGQNTYGIEKFPDANRFMRVNGQTGASNRLQGSSLSPDPTKLGVNEKNLVPGEQFFDEIKYVLQSKNINPEHVMCIGSPSFYKQILQIPAFRDYDNTIHNKMGESYNGSLHWHGLWFTILNYDSYINGAEQFVNKIANRAGKLVGTAVTGNGANATFSAPNKADLERDYETFLIIDFSGLIKGITHANFMGHAVREDYSYARQMYVKVGAAFSRMDNDKVIQVLFKKTGNTLV